MNKRFAKISVLAMAGAISIMSCRNIEPDSPVVRDEQNASPILPVNGKVNVQVNLMGTSFSANRGTYGLSDSGPQTIVREVSPGNTLVAELSPSISPFSDIVKGDNLPKDYPYRVFVFDQEDRTLVDYKDFKVGEEKPASFTLDFDGNYIFVAYTDASGKLPEFDINAPDEVDNGGGEEGKENKETPEDKDDKNVEAEDDSDSINVKKLDDIKIDFEGADIMYFKLDEYSPSKIGNIVNVTLVHRTSNLMLDVKQILYGDYVKDVSITPNYMGGSIKLSTGDIIDRNESVEYKIDQLTFDGPTGNVKSNLIPVNVADTLTFRAKIKQDNKFEDIELPFKLDLGTRYTLSLKLKYNCGAFISKELWKEFMCHNLGANYDAHPINSIVDLYGDKYQWGSKEPVSKHAEEVANMGKLINPINPSVTAWQDDFKTENDPCPNGYRIPKPSDFEGIIEFNDIALLKTWKENQNYLIKFSNDLILPFAGYRYYNGNSSRAIDGMNTHGYYWTSHATSKNVYTTFIVSNNNGTPYNVLKNDINNTYYGSIRCIKEDGSITARPDIPNVGTGWDKGENIEIDIDKIIKDRKDKEKEAKKKKKKGNRK